MTSACCVQVWGHSVCHGHFLVVENKGIAFPPYRDLEEIIAERNLSVDRGHDLALGPALRARFDLGGHANRPLMVT